MKNSAQIIKKKQENGERIQSKLWQRTQWKWRRRYKATSQTIFLSILQFLLDFSVILRDIHMENFVKLRRMDYGRDSDASVAQTDH